MLHFEELDPAIKELTLRMMAEHKKLQGSGIDPFVALLSKFVLFQHLDQGRFPSRHRAQRPAVNVRLNTIPPAEKQLLGGSRRWLPGR